MNRVYIGPSFILTRKLLENKIKSLELTLDQATRSVKSRQADLDNVLKTVAGRQKDLDYEVSRHAMTQTLLNDYKQELSRLS